MASKQLEQYKKLKADLDEEYHRRLKALQEYCGVEVDELSFEDTRSAMARKLFPKSTADAGIVPGEYGALNTAVKMALKNINGKFTATELWERVKALYPNALRPSVSAILIKLADDPEFKIDIVEDGIGNRPTIYRREA